MKMKFSKIVSQTLYDTLSCILWEIQITHIYIRIDC